MTRECDPEKEILSVSVPECPLCRGDGVLVHEGLSDELFGAPGTWGVRRCSDDECALSWLDPMPLPEHLPKAYASYYTHSSEPRGKVEGAGGRLLLFVARQVNSILKRCTSVGRTRKLLENFFLLPPEGRSVLEVGCGDGERLARLRDLGWTVYGQEVDFRAAEQARERFGIEVVVGDVASCGFEQGVFDVIVMNHVLEHVGKPDALLMYCYGLLKDEGQLICITPNSQSLGHHLFGQYWRGLEVPRHLQLFSVRALERLCGKSRLFEFEVATYAARANGIIEDSIRMKRGERPSGTAPDGKTYAASIGLQYLEHLLLKFIPTLGEELVLRVRKRRK